MSETHCSELAADTPPKKRGPKVDPNSLKFISVGLKPTFWDWVATFATDEERKQIAEKQEEGKDGNYTPALNRMVDRMRLLMPDGEKGGMPRDELGRWVSTGGTSKTSKTRANKRLRNKQYEPAAE